MVRNTLMPTKKQLNALPALYATETAPEKVAVVRYFFGGAGAFYACEFTVDAIGSASQTGGGVFFGWLVSDFYGQSEYCYMSLYDLKVRLAERDLHFSPKPLGDACKQNSDPLPFDLA